MNITVTDTATPELQRILAGVWNRQPILEKLGKWLEVELHAHFLQRNVDSANKSGFPRQNFWSRIRRATAFTGATNDTATVTIADPAIALKIYGGVVRPKETQSLVIPLTAAAYGVRPKNGTIPGLFVWKNKDTGKAFLANAAAGQLTLHYLLVKSVTHTPDPRALPDMTALEAKLAVRAEQLLLQKKITPEN